MAKNTAAAARSKKLYDKRKAEGLCVDCGDDQPTSVTQCDECRQKRSKSRKAFRCRKTPTMCVHAMCRHLRAPYKKSCAHHLEIRKQKRLDRINNGLCPCGRSNPKAKGYCDICTETKRKRRQEIKQQILDHYGKICVCCSESILVFLTLDHKDNNGANHRQTVTGGRGGIRFYRWLLSQGFPEGYQVLCWNCNVGRHLNGGVCPHHELKTEPSGSPFLSEP